MVGSTDSLDSSPELTMPEDRNAVPLNCWQDVCLSNIWIPSHLLPSRQKPSTNRAANIEFHTLKKKDSTKYLKSFSIYSEEDIFLSDNEDDILFCYSDERLPRKKAVKTGFEVSDASTSYDKKDMIINKSSHSYANKQNEYLETKRTSNLKAMPSVDNLFSIGNETTSEEYRTVNIIPERCNESSLNQEEKKGLHISLNDILDDTPQFNINNFRTSDDKFFSIPGNKLESNQKKGKKKKKATKHITLDKFLEDYSEEDRQNDCCNNYFKKLLREKNKSDGVQIRSTAEFPDLVTNDPKFIHFEKLETKCSQPSMKTFTEILNPSNEINENSEIDSEKAAAPTVPENENTHGKLVIENIPNEVSHDDIYSILCGYGEIINFSLEPTGEFLKARVEIDSICDIDWIIECLNETEAFGASTKMLHCYRQK